MAGAASLISIQIDDADVRAGLQALARQAQHLEPALREIGEVLTNSTKQRFADQAGPDGAKWAANTELTLERYLGRTKGNYKKSGDLSAKGKKRLGSKKVLTQDGFLGDTIHPQLQGDTLLVGTGLVYGAVQQFGNPDNRFYNTPRGAKAPIPPRPYLGISTDDRARILAILEDYLSRSGRQWP